MKTYSELISLPTFKERFEYLKLNGKVGEETFGFARYLNQKFYKSLDWLPIRDRIIIRDNGNDLAMEGYPIFGRIYIHHLNPITEEDIINVTDALINPEFLVCTSFDTHNAIHYGDIDMLAKEPVIRTLGDTCPWKTT